MAPLYESDEKGKLVPAKGEIPLEAISAIERADEDQIVERLTNANAQKWFAYSITFPTKEGEKEVTGISVDGANEIARMLGNIEVLPDVRVDKDSDEDFAYAMVRARDMLRNIVLLGTARACKYQLGKKNEPIKDRPNPWWFVIATNKAQRNAILAVAPQEAIAKALEGFKPELIKKLPKVPEISEPPVIEDEAEKNKLIQQLHADVERDLGKGAYEELMRPKLRERFGVESSKELNVSQLREALTIKDELIKQRETERKEIVNELKELAKDKGMGPDDVRKAMMEVVGKDHSSKMTLAELKEFKKHLEGLDSEERKFDF